MLDREGNPDRHYVVLKNGDDYAGVGQVIHKNQREGRAEVIDLIHPAHVVERLNRMELELAVTERRAEKALEGKRRWWRR